MKYDEDGKLKPGFVLLKTGEEVEFPIGRYHVRWYEGRKTTYKDVGDDPKRALAEMRRQSESLKAHHDAEADGVMVYFPRSLQKRIKEIAHEEGVTPAAWISIVVAAKIGAIDDGGKPPKNGKRKELEISSSSAPHGCAIPSTAAR